ncbi:ABC transporter ATP-binding protein [Streptomyces prunicolor]|uniref:ATP-binding cassette domain-containing protein n=1 Tax=Streptomyces prunicolor TaxID=67348 RepID=A0ABU4FHB4_9ACTN|nr:oligopeptide/dipeptide ABC transporter ATP-binding protein [Streptomyces prunicolor]MDV7219450.1 ATP-binding cassette domain-containing protein [Streptomyces prunicolor]
MSEPRLDLTVAEPTAPPPAADTGAPLLELAGIGHEFGRRPGRSGVRAVDDISLALNPGETVGLVGESGCGKSTLGRIATRLYRPTRGAVRFEGKDMTHKPKSADLKAFRRAVQMVFQDPNGSLNPRLPVGASIEEPLRARGVPRTERRERLAEVLEEVGLDASAAGRYPHEFSGGQRQRLALARALAPQPSVIVLDEPTSALDVSIQAQILNLLQEIQQRDRIAYLFISHNLGVVRHLSQRVAVMYLGSIVEIAPAQQLFEAPQHPYSMALLSSVLEPGDGTGPGEQIVLKGELPSPTDIPTGCPFSSRCWLADDHCRSERPALTEQTPGHLTACHKPGGHS